MRLAHFLVTGHKFECSCRACAAYNRSKKRGRVIAVSLLSDF